MAANDVIALEANFTSWKNNRFPNPAKGDNPFEYYCVEQFARSFDLGDSQLKAGMAGDGGDGGIDAFYIFANGDMVDSETEIDPKETPEFKLLIMQVKSDEGFSPIAVDKMYWFLGGATTADGYHPSFCLSGAGLRGAQRLVTRRLRPVPFGETIWRGRLSRR